MTSTRTFALASLLACGVFAPPALSGQVQELARGYFAEPDVKIKLKYYPVEVANVAVTIPPGGASPWHVHPGPTFVIVTAGQLTLAHEASGCPTVVYPQGSVFFEAEDEVHQVRNETAQPLQIIATQILPPGSPLLEPAPAPTDCNGR